MRLKLERKKITSVLEISISVLSDFVQVGIDRHLEPSRLARAGYAITASDCPKNGYFPVDALSSYLLEAQNKDGGWADVEETSWCLAYLQTLGAIYQTEVTAGVQWLKKMRLPVGAWGKTSRDLPRIPTTVLTLALVSEVASPATFNWISEQWAADLKSQVKLTYKGAFFLIAAAQYPSLADNDLISRTITHLVNEQEENGGFAPWKGHPIGSDPWSTSIVLWGLSLAGREAPLLAMEKALSWLKSTQLPSGYWPYHYLDDAASMAIIGITSALKHFPEDKSCVV